MKEDMNLHSILKRDVGNKLYFQERQRKSIWPPTDLDINFSTTTVFKLLSNPDPMLSSGIRGEKGGGVMPVST